MAPAWWTWRTRGTTRRALVASLAARALGEGAAELIAAAGRRGRGRPAASRGCPAGPARPGDPAADQADDLCSRLAAEGAVPVVVPMIRVTPRGRYRRAWMRRSRGWTPTAGSSLPAPTGWSSSCGGSPRSVRRGGVPAPRASPPWARAPPRHWSAAPSAWISFPAVHTAAALAEGLVGSEKRRAGGRGGAHAAGPRGTGGCRASSCAGTARWWTTSPSTGPNRARPPRWSLRPWTAAWTRSFSPAAPP